MNYRMILAILSRILWAEGVLLLPAAAVSVMYGEPAVWAILLTVAIAFALGVLCHCVKPKTHVIFAREGFVVVALSWVLMSLVGALPFFLSGAIPNYIDAFFETVSGFTTTGASILRDVEVVPKGLLYWRSFTHWVGGMGVLVFVLALMPLAGDRSMHLMRAEAPGPQVGKLVPKLRKTAGILYAIFTALTLVEIVLLCLGGMPLFDSVLNSFATMGTGGFAIKNTSIAYYNSAYLDGVITVFMALGGVNFNVYYLICVGHLVAAWRSEELWGYLGIMLGATLVIALNIRAEYAGFLQALRYASFQVSSIMTTTGFATTDFNKWPELSRTILLLLMVLGACAGSTGGGLKISRLIILLRSIGSEVRQMLHPRSVNIVRLDRKRVDQTTVHGVHVFLSTYIALLILSVLLVSIDGFDFETTFTAVISCQNNVGPGLGLVGPAGNYAAFSPWSKIVLSLDMLFGRLEIFPMMLLFAPSTWQGLGQKARGVLQKAK